MKEETASANTSPEEAILIKNIFPENAAAAITTTSLTTSVNPSAMQEEEPAFGVHVREAVAIVKDFLNRE